MFSKEMQNPFSDSSEFKDVCAKIFSRLIFLGFYCSQILNCLCGKCKKKKMAVTEFVQKIKYVKTTLILKNQCT